jgi:hypothetical protein
MKSLAIFLLILLFLHQINGQNSDEDRDGDESEEEEEDYDSDESDSEESTTTTTTTTKKPKTMITSKQTTIAIMSTTETPKPSTTDEPISTTMRAITAKPFEEKPLTTTVQTVDENDDKEDEEDEKRGEKSSDIEREEVEDEDNDYEEEGEEDNESDYYSELSREELLKNLIQRYSTSAMNMSLEKMNSSVNEKWIDFLTRSDNEVISLVRAITPVALDAFYELDLTASCSNSLLRMATGLQQSREWAFKSRSFFLFTNYKLCSTFDLRINLIFIFLLKIYYFQNNVSLKL